jgi:hypothetical protein
MALPVAAVIGLLAQYGPGLIKRLAGNRAGEVAEKVASVAQAVTGKPTVDEAMAAVAANPELAVQLKVRLAELQVDEDRIELQDREDARRHDLEVRKQNTGKNTRADVMVAVDAIGLILGLAGMVALGYFSAAFPGKISEGVFGALMAQLATITSYFGLCLRDAHQFEFGSSRGSRDKDQQLKELAAAE